MSIDLASGKTIDRTGSVVRLAPVLLLVLSASACDGSRTHSLPTGVPVLAADEQVVIPVADPQADTSVEIDGGAEMSAEANAEEGTDKDSDGVQDTLDVCSNTRALHPVDDQGCDLFSGKLENVEFQPDAHNLNEESTRALDQLVKRMQEYPDVVLAVSGHTDNRGNARDNLELSKKRVLAVVRYLVLNGIDGRRLLPHGYGESRPLFSNATDEGRSRNRRIEVSLVSPN